MAFAMRTTWNHRTKRSLHASPILAGLSTILLVLSLSAATLGALWAYVDLFPTDESVVQLSGRIAKTGTAATWTAVAIGLSLPLGQFGLRSILDRSKPQSGSAVVIVALVNVILAAIAQWFDLTLLRKVVTVTETLLAVLAMLVATVGIGIVIFRRYRRSVGTPTGAGL